MSRFLKRKIGITFWTIVVVGIAFGVKPLRSLVINDSDASLIRYLAGPTDDIQFDLGESRVQANDPIFMESASGDWRQIGYVSSVHVGDASNRLANLSWYANDIPADECELFEYRSSGSLEEVVATMLPPEKRRRIQERMAAAMSEHGDDLSDAFVPLVQESLKRSMPVIEVEFKKAVQRHRGDIDQLAERWNDEIVNERLIPLARKEIMPIVRRHGQPPAEDIGREIWDRASLWRFGWRAVYDKTPLPQKGLVQEEWKRFVQSEAVPVIEAHMDDIVMAVQKTLGDVANNSAVRAELASVADELVKDPETQLLVRTILKETLVENQELRKVWGEVWTSDEARQAIDDAGDRLEPVVRKIGDDLFGSRTGGIDPDFARVLRSQILGKDRRWIVAWHTSAPSSRQIKRSDKRMPYPVVYVASGDQRAIVDTKAAATESGQ